MFQKGDGYNPQTPLAYAIALKWFKVLGDFDNFR